MRPHLVCMTPLPDGMIPACGLLRFQYRPLSRQDAPAWLRHAPRIGGSPPPQVRDSTDTHPMWERVDRIATTEHANVYQAADGCTMLQYPGHPESITGVPVGYKVPSWYNNSLFFRMLSFPCAELSGLSHAGYKASGTGPGQWGFSSVR